MTAIQKISLKPSWFRGVVESFWFDHFILFLIMVNTWTLYLATLGEDHGVVEGIILMIFVAEAAMKIRAYGWTGYWQDAWNRFDFTLIIIGIVLILGIYESEAIGCLRVLRLLRTIRIIPMLRNVAEGLGRSVADTVGVFVIAFFLLLVCSLMATLTFQKEMAEFATFETSFVTLLTMIFFDRFDVVGEAWGHTWYGTVIVFTIFYIGVSFMTINLLIGVFSSAMQKADPLVQKIHQAVLLIYSIVLEIKHILIDARREDRERHEELMREVVSLRREVQALRRKPIKRARRK